MVILSYLIHYWYFLVGGVAVGTLIGFVKK